MKKAKTWSTITLAMIPICLAINYVGAQIAIALKLPMYLDVIGSIMMGAICGPIPGVVLGALSSAINSLSEPTAIAYIPVTVACGLVAGLLGKAGFMKQLWKSLIAGFVLAVAAVAISSPITAFLYGGISGTGNDVIVLGLQAAGMGLLPATLIATLITEFFDKLLSCWVVFFVVKALSDRQLSKFPLGYIYMRTVDEEEDKSEGRFLLTKDAYLNQAFM